MKKVKILSTVYRVCFAIVCLNIGTKLARNKRITLLPMIQAVLSKTCNMHGCQEETTYSGRPGVLFYTPSCPKYAPSCVLPASQKQSVRETLINVFISSYNKGKINQVLQIKRFNSVLQLRDCRRRFARDNSCHRRHFSEYTCNCSLDIRPYFMHKKGHGSC